MLRASLLLILAGSLLLSVQPAAAQTATPAAGPVYIVQAGDTLSSIAARFNVGLNDLMTANSITDPNVLSAGQQLIIPGLPGVTGELDTETVNFGDTLRSVARRNQVPEPLLQKLNHLVSPTEFYAGASMILPKLDSSSNLTDALTAASGQSLLEIAAQASSDPWTLAALNGLGGTWDGLPGDVIYAAGPASTQVTSGLPPAFQSAVIPNLPLLQGGTAEIIVKPAAGVKLSGTLVTYPLNFFALGDGRMVALQGIYVLLDPGLYPVHLQATLPDGSTQSFEQTVLVASGNYPKEALTVSSEMIDPAVTGPEDKQVAAITAAASPTKFWQAKFGLPVYVPAGSGPCIYDRFGTRRSFNGSDYIYFHSGIDFGVCFNERPFDIYAAASGKVVFAGPLTVRGNATIVDDGWGVYTAYYHQSQIGVAAGQQVEAGQLIGQIGATGRVTGPHLHFEIWVNGIQVNPQAWLDRAFP